MYHYWDNFVSYNCDACANGDHNGPCIIPTYFAPCVTETYNLTHYRYHFNRYEVK